MIHTLKRKSFNGENRGKMENFIRELEPVKNRVESEDQTNL